ncbi:MAG: endonuclease domain-containing protein [Ignavibacteriaceae bacterium]
MSLSKNPELILVAKTICRELRKNSTKEEDILWEKIRNRKLLNKKFYRQHPLFFDLLGKETFYVADFYCYETKLVIEIDGAYHGHQKVNDELRTDVINLLGVKVIRFKNEEVEKNIKRVLDKIKIYLTNE